LRQNVEAQPVHKRTAFRRRLSATTSRSFRKSRRPGSEHFAARRLRISRSVIQPPSSQTLQWRRSPPQSIFAGSRKPAKHNHRSPDGSRFYIDAANRVRRTQRKSGTADMLRSVREMFSNAAAKRL